MKKLGISVALALLASILVVSPVLAGSLSAPSNLTVEDSKVFRNLIHAGDILYVFEFEIEFPSDNYSTTPASDTIMFRLYDADNTTQVLMTSVPYVYAFFESNGYGRGVSSFYFAEGDTKPTWGDEVNIEIYPSPTQFEATDSGNKVVSPDRYVSETTQEANRDVLRDYVLLLSDRLEAAYQDTGIVLKSSTDSGIMLSPYGETYFRGAINGLQALCPQLFYIQTYIPEKITVQSYNMSLADTYAGRLATDDLGKGFSRAGDVIGVSGQAAAAIIVFGATFGLCIWTSKKQWGVEIGMVGGLIIAIFMSLIMGNVVFTVLMIGSLVAIMGIVWLLLLKRA